MVMDFTDMRETILLSLDNNYKIFKTLGVKHVRSDMFTQRILGGRRGAKRYSALSRGGRLGNNFESNN